MQAGIRSGLTSTGAGLLTGQSLKDATTMGITSGLSAYMQTPQQTAAPVSDAAGLTPEQVLSGQGASPVPGQPALEGTPLAPLSPESAMQAATAAPAAGQAQVPLASSDAAFNQALSGMQGPGAGTSPSWFQQAKNFLMPDTSPEAINARAADIVKASNGAVSMDTAIKQATPSALRTYGPAIGLGIAGLGMAGGFKQKPLEDSPFAQQMREPIDVPPSLQRPMQNLPGVQYDDQGNIVGSRAWSPYANMGPTEVATPGIFGQGAGFAPPPMYTPPQGAPTMGQGPIQQAYNQTSMYDPYMFQRFTQQPRRFNTGGVASLAQGGYPRRIGQISGPGTETSDEIPAMLSDGEFVMTARAVRGAGNGDRREGAKKMYAMMHQLEQNAARG